MGADLRFGESTVGADRADAGAVFVSRPQWRTIGRTGSRSSSVRRPSSVPLRERPTAAQVALVSSLGAALRPVGFAAIWAGARR